MQIKSSGFRRLLRLIHPDMHANHSTTRARANEGSLARMNGYIRALAEKDQDALSNPPTNISFFYATNPKNSKSTRSTPTQPHVLTLKRADSFYEAWEGLENQLQVLCGRGGIALSPGERVIPLLYKEDEATGVSGSSCPGMGNGYRDASEYVQRCLKDFIVTDVMKHRSFTSALDKAEFSECSQISQISKTGKHKHHYQLFKDLQRATQALETTVGLGQVVVDLYENVESTQEWNMALSLVTCILSQHTDAMQQDANAALRLWGPSPEIIDIEIVNDRGESSRMYRSGSRVKCVLLVQSTWQDLVSLLNENKEWITRLGMQRRKRRAKVWANAMNTLL